MKTIHLLAAFLAVLFFQLLANRANAQTTLNFDSVDASAGQVDATAYLASYGITETALIAGSSLGIENENNFYGTPGIAYASSSPNWLMPQPGADPNSVLLSFATPLTSLSFTRIEETGSGAGNSFGAWSAEIYSGATEIGSASASGYSIFNNNINPAQTYTFTASDITSIEFDGSSDGFYGTSGILMDDLTLTPVPEPTTVGLFGLGVLVCFQRLKIGRRI